jgi:fimbrial chaperone protein
MNCLPCITTSLIQSSGLMMALFKKQAMKLKVTAVGPAFVLAGMIISLLILFLSASPAFASNYKIDPTSLELGSNVRSGAFSVINGGNDKLNVQISVKGWTQDADGKDVYQDSRDIVFFPKIMTIDPNQQRVIRIGIKGPPSLQEKTYRLFVEEIPSQNKAANAQVTNKISAGLTIAFRYAVPIFIKPVRQQESSSIEKVEMSGGVVKAIVRNTGNIHTKLLKVTFRGKSKDGRELFSQEVGGWYILKGMSRPYEVTVPKELCGNLATIEINAQSEHFAIDGTLNVRKNMCAQ